MFCESVPCKYVLLLTLIVALEPSTCTNTSLSPDSKRLYHDIVSGHGLYYGFTKLTEMGGSNFKSAVFNEQKSKLWLVEFYNSWCGHCHRFAPTWKAFASNVYDWRDSVGIGAVDCANDANNQLCRDMEVMYYPMIKLFPPNSEDKFLGEDFQKGTVGEMRKSIVSKLKSYSQSKVEGVNLKPVVDSSLESLWSDLPSEVMFLVLVFESEESSVASELALDISRTKEVQVRLVNPSNEQLSSSVGIESHLDGVVVVERDSKITNLNVNNLTREEANKHVRQFLVDHGVNISLELPVSEVTVEPEVNIGDVMQIMQMEEEIKKKLHTTALSSVVFQLDLEGAIRYSLKNEVSLHGNISGERLKALKDYVHVLIKYFPFGQQGLDFLKKLNEKALLGRNEVSGKAFRQTFLRFEDEFKPFLLKQGWIGCRGSQAHYRGYPCSLWTLFHTLTVHEESKDKKLHDSKPEVVFAMAGYIKNFFTCSECAGHFTEMAKTMAGNVTSQSDGIMWLWAAHNRVNNRLAGDQTEDPEHKKVQFPSGEACPTCHSSNGSWNRTEVLTFLKNMYSNIVYLQEDDFTTSTTTIAPSIGPKYDKSLRHEMYGNEQGYRHHQIESNKRSMWDFNIFDISLCVVLYVCSVAILILVCIKFVFKRSYRKKPYIHDILTKV